MKPSSRPERARRVWVAPSRGRGLERHRVRGLPASAQHHVRLLPAPRRDARKKTVHAAEEDRADVAEQREAWFEGRPDLDPERLVLIDECGTSTRTARMCGRASRGERGRAPVPHGHWNTSPFVDAPRLSGVPAPMTLGGATNDAPFLADFERVPARTLTPGDIVVTDYPPSRQPPVVRTAIERAGAVFKRLSFDSPGFNPVETAFSKIKTLLRATAARTPPDLWDTIRDAIDAVTPDDYRDHFTAAGYEPE